MKSTLLSSPFARVALRTLGMAPVDREFHLGGGLGELRRLLCVDSGRLCELVAYLPLLARLRERYPELELQVMVEERAADLLRREPMLGGLIVYRSEQLKAHSSSYYRLLREVQGREFDGVVLIGELADGPRDLVAYASQAGLRIGIYQEEREQLLNCMLRWQGRERYRLEQASELARLFGLGSETGPWTFALRPDELRAADQLIHFRKPIREQPLIAVDPAPGLGERRLASGNLAYLVGHLAEHLRARVLLLHLDEDAAAAATLRQTLRAPALDMPPQSLRERLALLARCDLCVAGNSELFHIAVAMGVPALGVFTEADAAAWEPRGRAAAAVLRGRPGEQMALREIDAAVAGILHVRAS